MTSRECAGLARSSTAQCRPRRRPSSRASPLAQRRPPRRPATRRLAPGRQCRSRAPLPRSLVPMQPRRHPGCPAQHRVHQTAEARAPGRPQRPPERPAPIERLRRFCHHGRPRIQLDNHDLARRDAPVHSRCWHKHMTPSLFVLHRVYPAAGALPTAKSSEPAFMPCRVSTMPRSGAPWTASKSSNQGGAGRARSARTLPARELRLGAAELDGRLRRDSAGGPPDRQGLRGPWGCYATAMRSTWICRSRSHDWARSNANCMPSHVSGVEPNAFDTGRPFRWKRTPFHSPGWKAFGARRQASLHTR